MQNYVCKHLLNENDKTNWLLVSGVRVIPELDTPGHVGYGWQFPGSENFTVCVGQDPWMGYCPQPPCGQVRLC
jgi:hypothetical protein